MSPNADVGVANLRVLAAATDAIVLRTIERACSAEQHAFLFATDVAEAIATSAAEQPDLAFVDVTLEGGAGLALVHHLPTVAHGTSVYAIVPPSRVELGSQAMALGASGILLSPPSGDGLLLAISEVRGRRSAAEERGRISAELARWRRRTGLVEGIAQLAGDEDRAKTALVVAEALAEASRASGAAVYMVTGEQPEGRTRLAAVGSASILDDRVEEARQPADSAAESPRQTTPPNPGKALDGVHRIALSLGSRAVGYVLLDNPSAPEDSAVGALVHVASAVLGAWLPPPASSRSNVSAPSETVPEARVYAYRHFQDAAKREVERARRHGRRLSIGAILAPEPRAELEELILGVVRESDVLARGPAGAYYLLLPETGSLGAHTCRRRVLRLAAPQSETEDRRASTPPSASFPPSRLTIGVATYPHDGAVLESLTDRAQRRAEDAARSIVHMRALHTRPLGEIVDSLLDAPLPSAAIIIPPFSRGELSVAAAHALVAAACREALRGGSSTLLVAFRPESGLLAVVRAAADDPQATLHAIDASHLAASGGAEAVILVAEQGTWAYCARVSASIVLAAHSADPLLVDVLADRLARASGVKLS
jgi:ActR/RegA family two-component response regulator